MPKTDWKQVCAACAEGTPPERCAYYGDPNGCNAPTLGAHPEGDLAERLQEALEKAERRIAELERASGNVAAMREALADVDKYLGYIIPTRRENELRKACRAALATPARNCDRFDNYLDARAEYDGNIGAEEWRFGAWLFDKAEGGAE